MKRTKNESEQVHEREELGLRRPRGDPVHILKSERQHKDRKSNGKRGSREREADKEKSV